MSIGKILKSKWADNDDDVVAIIDKQLLSRAKYDFEEVREAVSSLNRYAKKEVRDEDEFMKLFFSLQEKIYADKPRSTGVFHPSSIMGECERKMYYEFSGVAPTDATIRKIDGKLQRIFDVGTWYHTYIQMLLWKSGILEQSEVHVVNKRKRIDGRADGILRLSKRTLLEIKTMNSFSYAKGKLKPFVKHQQQAGVYATVLGIEQICYLYVNKDTGEITSHIVKVNKELVVEVADVMELVLTAVKEEVAPKRVHCKSEISTMAKDCVFKSHCFKRRR